MKAMIDLRGASFRSPRDAEFVARVYPAKGRLYALSEKRKHVSNRSSFESLIAPGTRTLHSKALKASPCRAINVSAILQSCFLSPNASLPLYAIFIQL